MNYAFYIEHGKISSPIIGITLRFCFEYLPVIKSFLIGLKLFMFILSPAMIGFFPKKKVVKQPLAVLEHWGPFFLSHNYLFFF